MHSLSQVPFLHGQSISLRMSCIAPNLHCPFSRLIDFHVWRAVVPKSLQAEVVMLVPRLVDAAEHTQAAGALLGRLAEASRQGPGSEAGLRLPVLAALGQLRIDPAVAERVLRAALDVRTNVPVPEPDLYPRLYRSVMISEHIWMQTLF